MLLDVLKPKLNLMMTEDALIRMNVESEAGKMGVDFKWALERRRIYLADVIKGIREEMTNTLATNLAGANELELVLIKDYVSKANETINKFEMEGRIFKADNRNGVTDDMIQKAKDYPIEELLTNPIRRNVTNCIAHKDDHPSMGIKNNRVHCFACGFSGSTIDVAMMVHGIDFNKNFFAVNPVSPPHHFHSFTDGL